MTKDELRYPPNGWPAGHAATYFADPPDDFPKQCSESSDPNAADKSTEHLLDTLYRMDGRHRFLTKTSGAVVASNSHAAGYLRQSNCFDVRDGRLFGGKHASAGAMEELLLVEGLEVRTVVLDRRAGEGRCVAQSSAIGENLLCISLKPLTKDNLPELPDLQSLFGLTPSEANIAVSLFSGSTPQQIADEHEISIHTVRAHLRHCYSKLNVNCREEMWGKLLVYCMN